MRISLLQDDPSSIPGEILVSVEVSEIDDPPTFTYSHSFKYKVPSSREDDKESNGMYYGEVIIYADKLAASAGVDGTRFPFDLEKCRNADCKKENPDACPVIADRTNRLLVADVFHTRPKQDALHYFGVALCKALFSGHANQVLLETKPTHPNGRIFLDFNGHDELDAIPWEYAKDGTTFLVHQRRFTRIYRQREFQLSKLSLRIVAVVPDPVIPPDNPDANLPDLHLGEQFQSFINGHNFNNRKVKLERVFPPTVNQMDVTLMSEPETATVLHFMGHCAWRNGARSLIFEHSRSGKHEFVDALHISVPKHLRLAFLSACDTRDIARVLSEQGVPYTIGSYCPLPDDLARRFESKFYQLLAGGFTIEMAMWRARVFLNEQGDIRQSDYFPGAMVFYSSTLQEDNGMVECEEGKPMVQLHTPPNNLEWIPPTSSFYGRKKELVKLNAVLRDMADHNEQSCRIYTIKGVGGQGKTALAMEAVRRAAHLFPSGIFAWPFDRKAISITDYLRQFVHVLFPEEEARLSCQDDDNDSIQKLGQAIIKKFIGLPSCLLILDHADTLSFAEAQGEKDAIALVTWLKDITSRRDISVKILATSYDNLKWPMEGALSLKGFVDLDIPSGCKLFNENLNAEAKKNMKKEADGNTAQLLDELVTRLDGHPLSLVLLGRAAGRTQHLDKQLKGIVHEYYITMLADEDVEKKEFKERFQPMINTLTPQEQLFLCMCSLFAGPITPEILVIVSCLIGESELSAQRIGTSVETITENLERPCYRGLLTKRDGEYRIHVAVREGVRQHDTRLKLQLRLSIPGLFDDIFIICIPFDQGKLALLEWHLRSLQTSVNNIGVKNRTFGVRYYSIGEAGSQMVNNISGKTTTQKPRSFHGLIVFLCKASEAFTSDMSRLCKDQIVPIVAEEKTPFILTLTHVNDVFPNDSAMTRRFVLDWMQKVTETLRADLEKTYWIIRAEIPPGYNIQGKTDTLSETEVNTDDDDLTMASEIDFENIYTYGEFVGRQPELKRLNELLGDKKVRYVTIRGFGGIGKTALAIQAVKKFGSGKVIVQSLAGNPTSASVISRIAGSLSIDAAAFPNPGMLRTKVMQQLRGKETILFYLDNMEDIKQIADAEKADAAKKKDARSLIQFFLQMPENVKMLMTSRVALGWPKEEIVNLDGLGPQEGMQVFRQWIPDRLDDVDDENVMNISRLANGHPLSIRLLGGSFNNCMEPITEFIDNFNNRIQEATDYFDDRYDSVDTCIQYSYDYLDEVLQSFLDRLKLFQIPFTETLAKKAFDLSTTSSPASSTGISLHKLWQQSWLNEINYDPTLGDWRPKFMEKDTKFFVLHPRVRDFLIHRSGNSEDGNVDDGNVEDDNSAISNDPEIQFYTSLCYGVGFGVVIDLNRQIDWCTKAANKGHLEAQLTLAVFYEHGASGVGEDQDQAFNWYLMAAMAGEKTAQKQIEDRYLEKYKFWRKSVQNNTTKPLDIRFDITIPLLHRAAEYNKITLVRSLVEQPSTKVDVEDRYGRTPLYIAAEKGHVELLELLGFEFNANVNAKDKHGITPLHRAAENKHFKVVWLLIAELGADTNAKAKDGQVLLHYLAQDGHAQFVRLFATELKASTNAMDINKQTPLHRAAANGHVEVVRLLMTELGADAKIKDKGGQTPLHLAADRGHVEVVRLLITELGVDADDRDDVGRTLPLQAADNGLVEIMRLLVAELGTNPNTRGNDGRALLHRATDKGQLEVVKLLVAEFGADVNTKDYGGHTPLHSAAEDGHAEIMKLLVIEFKADVNAKDNDGRTPLHQAAGNGCIEAIRLLVAELGADIKIEDIDGRTPLHRAAENGCINAMRLLVADFGIDVNVRDKFGLTPLHRAADSGNIEVMRLLVTELGADANAKDKEGRTPLHRAADNRHVEVIKLLVEEFGVDANAEGKEDRTALSGAVVSGHAEIVELLMKMLLPKELNLEYKKIPSEGARALAKSLKQNMTLLQLNLRGNHIGAEGIYALVESLKQNTILTQLNLASANIGNEGARALAEYLKQNKTLIHLNIGFNKIGAEGARALAEALKQNKTLAQLNLEENFIDAEAAHNLAEALKQNKSLVQLNFQYNEIGIEGGRALADSLKQNTALTHLNLHGNKVGDEGAHALAEVLKENTTLTQLNLGRNNIGDEGVWALAKALEQNASLTQLNLFSNQFTNEGAQVLAESLKQNTTLTKLEH